MWIRTVHGISRESSSSHLQQRWRNSPRLQIPKMAVHLHNEPAGLKPCQFRLTYRNLVKCWRMLLPGRAHLIFTLWKRLPSWWRARAPKHWVTVVLQTPWNICLPFFSLLLFQQSSDPSMRNKITAKWNVEFHWLCHLYASATALQQLLLC